MTGECGHCWLSLYCCLCQQHPPTPPCPVDTLTKRQEVPSHFAKECRVQQKRCFIFLCPCFLLCGHHVWVECGAVDVRCPTCKVDSQLGEITVSCCAALLQGVHGWQQQLSGETRLASSANGGKCVMVGQGWEYDFASVRGNVVSLLFFLNPLHKKQDKRISAECLIECLHFYIFMVFKNNNRKEQILKNFRAVYILPKLMNVLSSRSGITSFFCIVGDVTMKQEERIFLWARSSLYLIIQSSKGATSGVRALVEGRCSW